MHKSVAGLGAAFCLLTAAAPSAALTVKIASSGLVSFGQDATGVFGTAGADLTGHLYSFSATFDLTNAGYFNNGARSDIYGGAAYSYLPVDPPSLGSGTLTIDGHAQTIHGLWNTWLFGSPTNDFQVVQDFSGDPAHAFNNAVSIDEAPGFGLSAFPDFVAPAGNLCSVVGSCTGGFSFDESLNGAVTTRAFGNLAPSLTTIRVLAAAPEPATWAMLVGGLGLMGARLRRRRLVPVRA